MRASILTKFSFMVMLAVSGTIAPRAEQKPYQPFGSALKLLYCHEAECGVDGPAGTGKSRACLEKVHLCSKKYAGMRSLVIRKTRTSLTQTTLVTFEKQVLVPSERVYFNTSAQEYRYPNGSVVAVGGLDKSTKIMSSEYDLIYVPEATELTEADWDALLTRLRNGVMPYQQIIFDCNPDAPGHWLKRREKLGKLKMFPSLHKENPTLYSPQTGQLTPKGAAYMAKLDNLTGVRKLRLRDGKWVQAEGVVFDRYFADTNLIDRFEIPKDWARLWVVDFGYKNPFCWQAWARSPDGDLYRYREIYKTKTLVEDHAKKILEVTNDEPRPEVIITDHDAEDRATLEKYLGMSTVPAKKDVSTGINAVNARLVVKENGKAGLYLLRDSLVEIDAARFDDKLPICLEDEIDVYVWDKKKEVPVKQNDHACDCTRYLVAHCDLNFDSSGADYFHTW
jgi:PBSX family phage terminase large subunit